MKRTLKIKDSMTRRSRKRTEEALKVGCQHKNLEFDDGCNIGSLWCRDCEQSVDIPRDAFIGFLEWRFPHEKKD